MSYEALQIGFYTPVASIPGIQNKIDSFTKLWISKYHSIPGKLDLYHYTGLDGVTGIITDRGMRCTSIHVQKDIFEIKYGKDLILNQLNNFIEQEHNEIVKKILIELHKLCPSIGPTGPHKIFIACFCEKENKPSQWEQYGAKGKGYNLYIPFNSKTVICSCKEKPEDIRRIIMRKVIYDPKEQIKIIGQYISTFIDGIYHALNYWELHMKKFGLSLEGLIALSGVNLLGDMMISMKDPKHENEEEWRMIRILLPDEIPKPDDKIYSYIYQRNSGIYEFPLQKINLGPITDKLKAKKYLEMFIEKSRTIPHTIKLKDKILIEHAR
ncbi:MAG: DUF2971 domain-containing protein [Ignavibacteriaceae bacterium]|nr:DUF2971 domain-containing protein [Ignavibacteriaceae bacterium]